MSEPTLDILKDLVTEARYFVDTYQPQSAEEETAQKILLERMDEALPPPVVEPVEQCERDLECARPNGHEGKCDDLPF